MTGKVASPRLFDVHVWIRRSCREYGGVKALASILLVAGHRTISDIKNLLFDITPSERLLKLEVGFSAIQVILYTISRNSNHLYSMLYVCSITFAVSFFLQPSISPKPSFVVVTLESLTLWYGETVIILATTRHPTFACTACTGWKLPSLVFSAVSLRFIRSSFVKGISLPRLNSLECSVSTKEAFSPSTSVNV